MARVKRGTKRRARRKKYLKRTKGFFLTKSKLYQSAQEAANRADRYAFRDRRVKKRQYRRLWIQRIGAAARLNGITYGQLIHGLKAAGVDLDRKILADIAVKDAAAFKLLAEQAPSFSAAIDALQGVVGTIERFAKEAGVSMQPDVSRTVAADAKAPSRSADVAPSINVGNGPIASRAEALVLLRQVAEYFRQAEPHSPAAYLADQAAKWGGMTLHEWLPLVLRDDGALARLQELLGVPAAPQP